MSGPNPLLFAHSTTSSIPHSNGSPGTPAAPIPAPNELDVGLLNVLLVGEGGLIAPPSLIVEAGDEIPVATPPPPPFETTCPFPFTFPLLKELATTCSVGVTTGGVATLLVARGEPRANAAGG